VKVYGASVSYYTGKLECYLRYKGIPYERSSPYPRAKEIKARVGAIQHPVVERDDGRWMSDTTPMILQLESEYPGGGILPDDPIVRFVALLIEDYADEWLWRAAMHYRWSYQHDKSLLSQILADELTSHIRLPRFLRCYAIKRRQYRGFVVRDGVTEKTRGHVEAGYHRILTLMTLILGEREFLLGGRPSIADMGLMGPMLRHFGQDPTPAEIMRDSAPAVFEWLGRMWHARSDVNENTFLNAIPPDIEPLLKEICETHLVQLEENAAAFSRGKSTFTMVVQGCRYRKLPVSRYRVACLEVLRMRFASLADVDQRTLRSLMHYEAASVLWRADVTTNAGYDLSGEAPFNKAINVFGEGVPS